MFREISIGVVVALAYILGAFLYFFTRDELNRYNNKIKLIKKSLRYIDPLYGVVLALIVFYNILEASLILFAIITAQTSFTSIKLKKKEALKRAGAQAITFLFVFAIAMVLNHVLF